MRGWRHMAEMRDSGTVQGMTRTRTAAVLVALCGLVMSSCSQGRGDGVVPIELGGTTTQPTVDPADGSGETISGGDAAGGTLILVDGWSAAGIAENSITWGSGEGEKGMVLNLEPATEDDIKLAIKKDPEAVANLMARMVTGDPTLACTEDGCQTAQRRIEYRELLEPQSGEVLGASYTDWGIETGVWVANIPTNATTLRYGGSTYDVVQPGEGEAVPAGIATGNGVEAIAVAFGRIFPITAAWLEGKVGYENRAFENAGEEPGRIAAEAFLGGLGVGVEGAQTLLASQLTWRSSPSTGCGVGVLCVPGVAKATLKASPVKKIKVCQGDQSGWIEMGAIDLTYTYKGRTNQFGVWGEAMPTGEISGRPMIWTSEPPYVQGEVKQHHVYAHLYDGLGLYDKSGRVSTIGLDEVAETSYLPGEEYLGKVFGGSWKPC